jgi:hypothetical protein
MADTIRENSSIVTNATSFGHDQRHLRRRQWLVREELQPRRRRRTTLTVGWQSNWSAYTGWI